jgi:hypothetical protein
LATRRQHLPVTIGGFLPASQLQQSSTDLTVEALGFRQIAGLVLGKRRVEYIYRHVLVARVRVPVAAL